MKRIAFAIILASLVGAGAFTAPASRTHAAPLQEWETRASLPEARALFGIAVSETRIWIAGGEPAPCTFSDTLFEYTPGSDTWQTMSPMPLGPRSRLGLSIVGFNKILAIGGSVGCGGSHQVLKRTEEWDRATNTWTPRADMLEARRDFAVRQDAVSGETWVFGGRDASGNCLASVEKYQPATDTWTALPPMPEPYCEDGGGRAFGHGPHIYLVRGRSQTVLKYYLPSGTWLPANATTPIPRDRDGFAVAQSGNAIVALGGTDHSPGIAAATTALIYYADTDTWVETDTLASFMPRRGLSAITFGSTRTIYAIGGADAALGPEHSTANQAQRPAELALDMDISNGSGPCSPIDASRTTPVGSSVQVGVCLISGAPSRIAAFRYNVSYDDTVAVAPEVVDVGTGLDDNPDANEGATTFQTPTLGPGWDCSAGVGAYPKGDTDGVVDGDGTVFSGGCGSFLTTMTQTDGVLSVITFNATNAGTTALEFSRAEVTDVSIAQVGSCDPVTDAPIVCTGGTLHVVGPAGPAVNKSPANANLFICELGPCAGPGEGDVVISEVVQNVTEPLGAWEIQIKFDRKIFNVEIDPNEALFTAHGRTPNCNIQVVTENWILFGCVSTGPVGSGFTGGPATLATVTLTPNEDLRFRLHPGNDNGVVRMILDENCEVANTLGHPQPGSVNGGLAEECGDASVTVRILEGDLNLDCNVDLLDQQLIASKYGTFFGNLFYDPWFDLEPALKDFDIDIKDLQKVFGRDGSTCQAPIPPQPPIEGMSVGPL
jgi:N-acetylneuraminic acid mutarotase